MEMFIRNDPGWIKNLPSARCCTAELGKLCQQGGRWKWSGANFMKERAWAVRRRQKAVLTGVYLPFFIMLSLLWVEKAKAVLHCWHKLVVYHSASWVCAATHKIPIYKTYPEFSYVVWDSHKVCDASSARTCMVTEQCMLFRTIKYLL